MTSDSEFIPTVVAIEFRGNLNDMEPIDAEKLFIQLLSNISKDCISSGAMMIGHNKANYKCGDDLLSISCTTDDGNVRTKCTFNNKVSDYSGVMNIIVYGIEYETISEIVTKRSSVLNDVQIKIHKQGDTTCDDPECHDPACTDPTHRKGTFVKMEGML